MADGPEDETTLVPDEPVLDEPAVRRDDGAEAGDVTTRREPDSNQWQAEDADGEPCFYTEVLVE